MLTGIVYTLVGIKNKLLHISLSAAYLAGLAVTVLIIYVMNPPISNSIQGAYVVAVTMTGIILGGAAIVFTEMTEGLGCLLGGFCFSMWLLVLKPGGLLTSTSAKAGFIAAFTLAGFATSFSHITRPYGLIGFISFSGATAVVLGIDCFSRAGLKEFWAYIWDLNDNLFPVGATTYPLTRGMKVEIAAIIVIFLAGLMSQMKLWKIIKERREQRAAERLEDERTMQHEEENVGRCIEQHNAQERNQWEAVYGDKENAKSHGQRSNRDSGLGDMDSQKKGPTSTVTSFRRSGDEEIEMTDIPSPTLTTGAGLVMSKGVDGGPITVRVARDPEPPMILDENGNRIGGTAKRLSHVSEWSSSKDIPQEEDVWVVGADGEARIEACPSKRNSQRNSKRTSAGPAVVPLPFKVPEGEIEDDNSSVATFADDEQTVENRKSKHLSAGSAFMKRLSRGSHRSSKRLSTGEGNSTEDLVIPRGIDDGRVSRASSLAATMDGLSDDEDMRSTRSSIVHVGDTQEVLASQIQVEELDATHSSLDAEFMEEANKRLSAITVDMGIRELSQRNVQEREKPAQEFPALTSSTEPKAEKKKAAKPDLECEETEKAANGAPSVVSAAESKPATLTKESLPPQLSKVVMSYRTNEWAKHLSTAEAPDFEEMKLAEYPAETEEKKVEVAAPVNVEELQQTPENAAPAPCRTMSQMSNYPQALTRSSSAMSKTNAPPYPSRLETSNGESISRSTSQLSFHAPAPQTQLNTRLPYRISSTPIISQPIVESPIEEDTSASNPNLARFASPNPYGSQPTLIGQRDTMLKSKSSLYLASSTTLPSNPEFLQSQSQFHSSGATSQIASDTTSLHPLVDDDDTMSLSQRRSLIRQQSLIQAPVPFDSHQPRRSYTAASPMAREQQLASFRASVQNELASAVPPRATIERQRSALWQEKQAEEQRKQMESRMRGVRDSAFDERMRRGDMLGAHREALRRMQRVASGNAG
jgi:hypothetical protein